MEGPGNPEDEKRWSIPHLLNISEKPIDKTKKPPQPITAKEVGPYTPPYVLLI